MSSCVRMVQRRDGTGFVLESFTETRSTTPSTTSVTACRSSAPRPDYMAHPVLYTCSIGLLPGDYSEVPEGGAV